MWPGNVGLVAGYMVWVPGMWGLWLDIWFWIRECGACGWIYGFGSGNVGLVAGYMVWVPGMWGLWLDIWFGFRILDIWFWIRECGACGWIYGFGSGNVGLVAGYMVLDPGMWSLWLDIWFWIRECGALAGYMVLDPGMWGLWLIDHGMCGLWLIDHGMWGLWLTDHGMCGLWLISRNVGIVADRSRNVWIVADRSRNVGIVADTCGAWSGNPVYDLTEASSCVEKSLHNGPDIEGWLIRVHIITDIHYFASVVWCPKCNGFRYHGGRSVRVVHDGSYIYTRFCVDSLTVDCVFVCIMIELTSQCNHTVTNINHQSLGTHWVVLWSWCCLFIIIYSWR